MKKLGANFDQELLKRARLLERMTASARSRLPRHLAEHCWVGACDGTRLTLITDNAAFTTPIHYQQQEIVKQLNEEFAAELGCRLKKAAVRVSRFPMPGAPE